MSLFDDASKKAASGEVIERITHMISKGMADAASHGKNDAEIAAAGLKAAEDPSIISKLVGDVPGLTTTMASAVIAAKLQEFDFEKLLPGNTHPGVVAAKFFLKDIAPHIIIGAGEGFGDKLSDAIDRAVGKVRSNPKVAVPVAQKGSADVVCWVKPDLGQRDKFFLIEYENAENKTPRYHHRIKADGTDVVTSVPMCRNPEFQRIKDAWDRTHTRRKEKVPVENQTQQQGNGKQNNSQPREREIWVDAEDLPCEIIPLEVAVRRLGENMVGMTPELAQGVKDLFKKPDKPKTWAEKISSQSHDFTFAVSTTLAVLGMHEHDLGQDLLEDLPDSEVIMMDKLAAYFVPRIQTDGPFKDGFSHEDFLKIMSHTSTWMGAKLKWINKIRLAYSYMRASMKSGAVQWNDAVPTFFLATFPMWLFLIVTTALFVGALSLFIIGSVHDTNQPLDLYFAQYRAGRWPAFAATMVGAWSMMLIVTIVFPFVQSVLNWVTILVPNASKEGIKKTGWKIIAFFGVYGDLAGLMILGGVPLMYRVIPLLVTPLGAYGIVAMLSSIEGETVIRNKVYSATKWFWWIMVILPFATAIVFAVLGIFDVTPVIAFAWVKELFRHPMVQSLVGGAVVSVLAYLVLKKIEWTKNKRDGIEYEDTIPNWMARGVFLILFLVAIIYPWVDFPHNKYKVPEPPVAGSEDELKKAKAENDRLKAEVLKRSKVPSVADSAPVIVRSARAQHTEKSSKNADPCAADQTYTARHDQHCPCCP